MTHFSEYQGIDPVIVRRLQQITMTESERKAAMLSVQRGERVAEFLFGAVQAARRLNSAAARGLAIALRELEAWLANRRRNRAETHRRAHTRRAGST